MGVGADVGVGTPRATGIFLRPRSTMARVQRVYPQSNVLNHKPHVRDATREKVEAAMRLLDYRVNVVARNLRARAAPSPLAWRLRR